MPGWKWFLVFFSTGYLALVALMYVAQRGLMYFPETIRTAPAEAGLPEAEEVVLDTPDGARVIVWHIPPKDERRSGSISTATAARCAIASTASAN